MIPFVCTSSAFKRYITGFELSRIYSEKSRGLVTDEFFELSQKNSETLADPVLMNTPYPFIPGEHWVNWIDIIEEHYNTQHKEYRLKIFANCGELIFEQEKKEHHIHDIGIYLNKYSECFGLKNTSEIFNSVFI